MGRRPHSKNDRGAGALEYGALIALAAVVVGIVYAAVPGVAEPKVKDAVCRLFGGGDCGSGKPGEETEAGDEGDQREPAAPQPCVVSTVERNTVRQTLLGLDTEVSGESRSVQIMSDGTAVLKEGTLSGQGTSIGFGFDLPKGVSGSVQLTSNDITEQGEILYLDTPEKRDLYMAYFKANGELNMGVLTGEVKSPEELLEKKSMLNSIRQSMVQSQYTKVGKEGTVKIAAGLFGATAGAELGLSDASVVQRNKNTGETTTTFQVDAKALGQLGILVVGEAHAQADGQVSLAVTTDANGKPKNVQISGQMGFQGQVNGLNGDLGGAVDLAPTGKMGRLGNLLNSAATSVGVTNTTDPRGMLQVNLGLDLTDPENKRAFEAFLGDPLHPDALLGRLNSNGTLDIQAYEGESHKEGAELGIQAVFGIGAKGEETTTKMDLVDAYSFDAQGLHHRTDCLK
jgi:Flp pilus assembly pilin Flp